MRGALLVRQAYRAELVGRATAPVICDLCELNVKGLQRTNQIVSCARS
jgi:hypothetical protein